MPYCADYCPLLRCGGFPGMSCQAILTIISNITIIIVMIILSGFVNAWTMLQTLCRLLTSVCVRHIRSCYIRHARY